MRQDELPGAAASRLECGEPNGPFIHHPPMHVHDFILLLLPWQIFVSVAALKLRDRPRWNLQGTKTTDGGRGGGVRAWAEHTST